MGFVGTGRRGRGANSQLAVPRNITLADIDADGKTDFVQTSGNRLFASKTDFQKTGILHLYQRRNIKRVLTGDFHGDRYDQTCVIQDDNALVCFGISTDRKELWWWFTQGSFLSDSDDFIVGDYTGDGRDDILVYPRGGGAWRMYSLSGDYFFAPTPGFAPGNLNTATSGLQVRAGDFNADSRDDLALVNGWGQVIYYASVYSGGQHTFWWAFTTNSGVVGGNDQVTIARIDDDNDDDVVLRDRVTGATRFYRMEWAGGPLPALTTVPTGQISATGNSLLFWGALHDVTTAPGSARRDDALVYELGWNGFVRSDAAWTGSAYTYWWAYTQYAPDNHAGWQPLVSKPWLFLKCRFSDIATIPAADSFYQNMMFGTWGLGHYWLENTYGTYDTYTSTLPNTWYGMSYTNAAWRTDLDRWGKVGACINAYGGSTAGYVDVIAMVNGEGDAGNHGGRVLMTPTISHSTFLAHETGHTFGYWDHSYDDTTLTGPYAGPGEYRDPWDIMSAMAVYGFATPVGTAGPGINTPYLHKLGFVPAHRRVQLNSTSASQTATLTLAALNRPEANGSLYARIGSNDNDHITLEFRMKSGFDQGIPQHTVLVHRVENGVSKLQTSYGGAQRLPGSGGWYWASTKWIYVTVNSITPASATASVTVSY